MKRVNFVRTRAEDYNRTSKDIW